MNPVRVSIVIPTKNNIPFLSLCLSSVINTLTEDDEVIVVSNGTDADKSVTVGYVNGIRQLKTKPSVKVFHIEEGGFSPACNYGLQKALGEYVILLNDDTIVASNWLQAIFSAEKDAMKTAPEIKWGYMGPRSNAALPIQTISPEQGYPGCNQPNGVEETAIRLASAKGRHEFIAASQVSGFCLVIKRECLDATGLLDSFGLGGFEDNDYCLRAQQKGYLGFIACRSFVFHFSHRTLDRVNEGHKGGTELIEPFLKKWYNPEEKKLCVSYRVRIDTEEDLRYFVSSVTAVKKFADFIVVLNDHSKIDFWTNNDSFTKVEHVQEDNHGEVRDRNRLLQIARSTGADWNWNLDHDEVPDGVTREYLQQLMNPVNPSTKLYIMNLHTLWRDEETVRADGIWHNLSLKSLHSLEATYGDIHGEQGSDFHCARGPAFLPGDSVQRCYGITVKHYGYTSPVRCREKQARYRAADTVKNVGLIGTPNYEHLTDEANIILLPYRAPKVGYLLLAKNEKLDVLMRLRQYRDAFSDFVVVDTGSSDGTAEVAKYLGARVYKYECCDKARDPDHLICDFSKARNFAIEQMDTDYIMFNDPDEELTGPCINDLDKTLLENADGYFIEIDNLNRGAKGELICYKTWQPRLFRNDNRIRYTEKIHETLENSFTSHPELVLMQSNLHLLHYGFLKTTPEERKKKNDKYAKHLVEILKEDPNNSRAIYALAVHFNDNHQFDQGDPMLGQALSLNPDFWSARWELSLRFCHRALDLMLDAFTSGKYPRDSRLQPAQQLIKDLIKWFPDVQARVTTGD
jgi:GT2 family glycosyltransferase/tetratricopeptide (TPR) repeat protein